MKHLTILLFTFICVGITSCKDKPDPEPKPNPTPAHTVLVYMGGDNNLGMETYQKLQTICKGWNSAFDGNLLIYQDTKYNDSPRLIKVTGIGSNYSPQYELIKKYDQSNSADPKIFQQAIMEVKEAYPAKEYGLIVFSHASGWLPAHTMIPNYTPSTRSIIIDNDDEMDIKDFAEVIPNEAFKYIIFEACLMANIEVAFEMKDKTDYILASSAPIISPGFTEIYQTSIQHLFEETPNIEVFAKNYFNLWNSKAGLERSATVSIIKTAELSALAEVIRSILKNKIGNIEVGSLQNFDGRIQSPYYFFDFAQYYALLANDTQKQELNNILNRCVIYKNNTPSYSSYPDNTFPINTHSGLTTYIEQDNLSGINVEYQKLKWYNATR